MADYRRELEDLEAEVRRELVFPPLDACQQVEDVDEPYLAFRHGGRRALSECPAIERALSRTPSQ